MKACSEFYCRQIARKFSLKFPLRITNLERLIQSSFFFFGGGGGQGGGGGGLFSFPLYVLGGSFFLFLFCFVLFSQKTT